VGLLFLRERHLRVTLELQQTLVELIFLVLKPLVVILLLFLQPTDLSCNKQFNNVSKKLLNSHKMSTILNKQLQLSSLEMWLVKPE
jgi:hypothetical protein